MKDENIKDRFQDAADDLFEYGRLQLDALKLRTVGSLAPLCGKIIATALLMLVAIIALLFLSITLTLLLAQWIGSLLWAAAIMTVVLLIVVLILYLFRKKLFVNSMVRMWAKMLFKSEEDK